MATLQLGIQPLHNHRVRPCSRRGTSLSRPPGAEMAPNPHPTAPNKPNLPDARIPVSICIECLYGKTHTLAGQTKQTQSNPIAAPGPTPSQLSNIRSRILIPGPPRCHHPRQTNPISPVSGPGTPVAPKNKPNLPHAEIGWQPPAHGLEWPQYRAIGRGPRPARSGPPAGQWIREPLTTGERS